MPYEFKAPLAVKILFGAVVIALLIYNVFYVSYRANKNKKEFYEKEFSSVVLSSNSFEGRTVEFHLENGLKLYFLPPVESKIMVGDSIRKEKETYRYKVYRKNDNNKYKYFSTYDFDQIQ